MGKVTGYMYEHEDRDARRKEDDVRGGRSPYEVAAEKAASVAGTSLDPGQRAQLGSALHWALGIGAGAAYAVLRRRVQGLGSVAGTAFGTGFWAFMDEGLVPALGLTPGATAFPWQAHRAVWSAIPSAPSPTARSGCSTGWPEQEAPWKTRSSEMPRTSRENSRRCSTR